MEQTVILSDDNYKMFDDYLLSHKVSKIFLVKSEFCDSFKITDYFNGLTERLNIEIVSFTHYHPNPEYDSVVEGEKLFRESKCDCIAAVGGGSCIDVAKCIKLYYGLDSSKNYMQQNPIENNIPLIVLPTTAGTGSEATRYAVIYYNDEKQSITHDSIIPGAVIFDPSVLDTLPDYQRKATMMDAFCHAIEAFWSVNSTEESKKYSREAIRLVLENYKLYLNNDPVGNKNMLVAANIAGKAINITQTTAGHAMCYKLTNMYNTAHGHAAAICVSVLWPFMIRHTDNCIDPRGESYLKNVFIELADAMQSDSPLAAAEKFIEIFNETGLSIPVVNNDNDFELLKKSVNPVRLKNNPVKLTEDSIEKMYRSVLK
ncbi:MAG: phosphonoacetaldehyde reductase [Treponema sp.]|uniref:phosphonoacetaldehyde reductase n=1 Tax=Treponema sp. TaxID=166 RepID=UPI00298E787E|nr:phosphonoacetaldehyde reductase [Treponema sp.]MBR5934237.1 phosphonoacetaldehyde reductase [Treponema sp.]